MLTKEGHLLNSSTFTRHSLEDFFLDVFKLKNTLSTNKGRKDLASRYSHCGALLYFTQNSTRTFFSFQRACQIFGVRTSEFKDKTSSSIEKGESESDTLKTLAQYNDLIISRTLDEKIPAFLSEMTAKLDSRKFIINAGSGMLEHPTQALLDLYTIWEQYRIARDQEVKALKVVVVGDLKRGRAAKSFIKTMSLFPKMHFELVSEPAYKLDSETLGAIKSQSHSLCESASLSTSLQDADIVYMTRMQDEYAGTSDAASFCLTPELVRSMKNTAMILHPLPRREELPESIDQDPRAHYWQQEAQGLWVRTALIDKQLSQIFQFYLQKGIHMKISSNFDGGNIRYLDHSTGSTAVDVNLEINKDHNSDFYQWFYYRVTGARAQDCRFIIGNAGGASYIDGWKDYQAVASYDRETWFRVDTKYEDGNLVISHQPEFNSVYYAYFAPYTTEQHRDLISQAQLSPLVDYHCLGSTLDGQDMDLLVIGDEDPNKKKCWVIARQHPGETMAEWFMEGWLGRVLDSTDPVSKELLKHATFYVVPNMNPDGSKRGHLRTNASGANLNREWQEPSMDRSPEVYLVREKMQEVGVDFCLDVHGDEGLPYNFIAGAEGVPKWTPQLLKLQNTYKEALQRANPDFQCTHGYDIDKPGEANLTICTNYIAQHFNCLSMTLEMPFKDTKDCPDEVYGWSPERCHKLGHSNVDALYNVMREL